MTSCAGNRAVRALRAGTTCRGRGRSGRASSRSDRGSARTPCGRPRAKCPSCGSSWHPAQARGRPAKARAPAVPDGRRGRPRRVCASASAKPVRAWSNATVRPGRRSVAAVAGAPKRAVLPAVRVRVALRAAGRGEAELLRARGGAARHGPPAAASRRSAHLAVAGVAGHGQVGAGERMRRAFAWSSGVEARGHEPVHAVAGLAAAAVPCARAGRRGGRRGSRRSARAPSAAAGPRGGTTRRRPPRGGRSSGKRVRAWSNGPVATCAKPAVRVAARAGGAQPARVRVAVARRAGRRRACPGSAARPFGRARGSRRRPPRVAAREREARARVVEAARLDPATSPRSCGRIAHAAPRRPACGSRWQAAQVWCAMPLKRAAPSGGGWRGTPRRPPPGASPSAGNRVRVVVERAAASSPSARGSPRRRAARTGRGAGPRGTTRRRGRGPRNVRARFTPPRESAGRVADVLRPGGSDAQRAARAGPASGNPVCAWSNAARPASRPRRRGRRRGPGARCGSARRPVLGPRVQAASGGDPLAESAVWQRRQSSRRDALARRVAGPAVARAVERLVEAADSSPGENCARAGRDASGEQRRGQQGAAHGQPRPYPVAERHRDVHARRTRT